MLRNSSGRKENTLHRNLPQYVYEVNDDRIPTVFLYH